MVAVIRIGDDMKQRKMDRADFEAATILLLGVSREWMRSQDIINFCAQMGLQLPLSTAGTWLVAMANSGKVDRRTIAGGNYEYHIPSNAD